MFDVKHIKKKSSNFIEVKDSSNNVYAKVDLNLGGSLQELTLNGKTIIASKETSLYETSYASAILFPFANRIENGAYFYNDKSYQLNINKEEENNAIHGLVYDKVFKVIHFAGTKHQAEIYIRYIAKDDNPGFPFKYVITVSYVIQRASLKMIVEIKNIDTFSFPFTIGWHPYFVSSDLHNSYLNFGSSKRLLVNTQGIPKEETSIEAPKELQIKNLELDDCFILNSKHLELKTPDYQMDFDFSLDENYIQIYTPPNRKTIAIEPQTGSANNFNDNRGLKTLLPQQLYEVSWNININ